MDTELEIYLHIRWVTSSETIYNVDFIRLLRFRGLGHQLANAASFSL